MDKNYTLQLEGCFITPILTNRKAFHMFGCKWDLSQAKKISYSKLHLDKPFPFHKRGYSGKVTVTYKCRNLTSAEKKKNVLRQIHQLSQLNREGAGEIRWIEGKFIQNSEIDRAFKPYFPKTRKSLPTDLAESIQYLVLYGLLHDFYNTAIHQSKTYSEPRLDNYELVELIRRSHDIPKPYDTLTREFTFFDQMSARLTRTHKVKIENLYNIKANGKIVDHKRLSRKIAKLVNKNKGRLHELYRFLLENEELDLFCESLDYGDTSLKQHVILISNMIVKSWLNGRLSDYHEKMSRELTRGWLNWN